MRYPGEIALIKIASITNPIKKKILRRFLKKIDNII